MKAILNLALLVTLAFSCAAQKSILKDRSIAIAHDRYASAENLNLTFRQTFKADISLYIGVKYHINGPRTYHGTIVLHQDAIVDKFYAQDNSQRFGLKLGIEKAVTLSKNVDAFAFYDFQYGRLQYETYEFLGLGNDTVNGYIGPVYEKSTRRDGYYNAFEHHVGIGSRIRINNPLSVRLQAGLGYSLITGPFTPDIPTGISKFGLFSRMFSLGFEYKLSREKPRNDRR